MSAPRKTLAQYLQWAALKPRTSEWSALIAYDRNKCNQLLLQEYIEKHHQQSVMPPINEAYRSSETTWHWLLDYVTDAPRLSFENDPASNVAEVNLSIAIVGGKKVTLDDSAGYARITNISAFDPLDYPCLEAERVLLKDVQGSVNQAGKVLLDLGDPDSQRHDWRVTGERTEDERRMAGAFFKRKFQEADLARRTFTLGMLAPTNQAFMKPQKFRLRTVMQEGAASRGAANFGDGALEMRIAMDDEPAGGSPGQDWVYPLPSDRSDLDTLTILGSHFFMHGVIGKGTARAFNVPQARFDSRTDAKGFVEWLGVRPVSGGYLEVPPLEVTANGKTLTFLDYRVPIYINQDHRLTMSLYRGADGSPRLEVGMGAQNSKSSIVCKMNGIRYRCSLGFGMSSIYRFTLDPTSRRLDVNLNSFNAYVDFIPNLLLPPSVASYVRSIEFANSLGNLVALKALQIFNGLDEIDLFTLNTLYFNAEDAVQLKTANLTGEMILLGSISPRASAFTIDPVQALLSHGQPQLFKTLPSTPGVTWTVEDLDGNTCGVGQMNAQTGAYIAPSLADIQGTYKRIKVIATAPGQGSERHISRALITVVARAITLNPLIDTCNAAPDTRELSAHSAGGTLRWRVEGDGRINETANAEGKNTYHAPPVRAPGVPTFTVDEVVVENITTGQRQRSLIVVNHHRQAMALNVDLSGVLPNQAQLTALVGGQPPPAPLTWRCMPPEAGSIDSTTGLFTANEQGAGQFVLITVLMELGGIEFDGFTILPLPLAPFPPKPAPEALHASTGAVACAQGVRTPMSSRAVSFN
ncbi:hypothetical protein V3H56_20110 [Pseudomonas sp. MS646]|uniref:hypothetical protein n=1 Tax=Pseudomonas sp. MS646 TaxID=3118751 RepID=UPI000AD0F807